MKWLILIIGVICNALASAFIKVAVSSPLIRGFSDAPFILLKSYLFWLGVLFYGIALISYSLALMKIPLSIVHPVLTSGSMAIIILLSFFLFEEQITSLKAVGLLLIVVGIIILTY